MAKSNIVHKLPIMLWHPDDAPVHLTQSLPDYYHITWIVLIPPYYRETDLGCVFTHDARVGSVLELEGPEGALLIVGYV